MLLLLLSSSIAEVGFELLQSNVKQQPSHEMISKEMG